jgi:hypothetical protein
VAVAGDHVVTVGAGGNVGRVSDPDAVAPATGAPRGRGGVMRMYAGGEFMLRAGVLVAPSVITSVAPAAAAGLTFD